MGFTEFSLLAFLVYVIDTYATVLYYVCVLIKEAALIILDYFNAKNTNKLLNSRIKSRTNTNVIENATTQKPTQVRYKLRILVNNLRLQYPLADEALFNTYLTRYDSLPLYEIERLEKAIAYSHQQNERNPKKERVQYTIKDVLKTREFNQVFILPITIKFYKIGVDYILSLEHSNTKEIVMYHSKSYKILLDVAYEVHENIHLKSQQCKQITIDNLFIKDNYNNITQIY